MRSGEPLRLAAELRIIGSRRCRTRRAAKNACTRATASGPRSPPTLWSAQTREPVELRPALSSRGLLLSPTALGERSSVVNLGKWLETRHRDHVG